MKKYKFIDQPNTNDIKLSQLSEYAIKKLEYINGNCITRDFPNKQPTLEWVGAVLDLLEELGLDKI